MFPFLTLLAKTTKSSILFITKGSVSVPVPSNTPGFSSVTCSTSIPSTYWLIKSSVLAKFVFSSFSACSVLFFASCALVNIPL